MKFYAVVKGRNPGIYTSWDSCKDQVHKFKGARFKSFPTRLQAKEYFEISEAGVPPLGDPIDLTNIRSRTSSTNSENDAPLPVQSNTRDLLEVYTDGSCLNNGSDGAVAGIGVYFGPNDSRNVSETIDGPQTNNRAELLAVIKALELIKHGQKAVIYTDSEYVQQGLTKWLSSWKGNNWKLSSGGMVKNEDLWKYLDVLYAQKNGNVKMEHVKAHVGTVGNEMADKLARQGAGQT